MRHRASPALFLVLGLLACSACESTGSRDEPRAATTLARTMFLLPAGFLAGSGEVVDGGPYRVVAMGAAEIAALSKDALTPPGPLEPVTLPSIQAWPSGMADIGVAQRIEPLFGAKTPHTLQSHVNGWPGVRIAESGEPELRLDYKASLTIDSTGEDSAFPRALRVEGRLWFEGRRPAPGTGMLFLAPTAGTGPQHGVLFVVTSAAGGR